MNWWPALVRLAEKGGSSEAELKDKIARGHSVVWEADDYCVVLDHACDDACVIWLCVGRNVRAWVHHLIADIATAARQQGCTRLRIEGRKGWRRLLPDWELNGDFLELPL